LNNAINPTTKKTKTINTKGIQIGDNTHNQDQLIVPVNFSVIKRIASNPGKPIPLALVFVCDMSFTPP